MAAGGAWERANQANEDPGAKARDGSIGVIARGETVPPFEEAAFALAPGELGPVTETPFGFHVLRRPRLSEVRGDFRDGVRQRMMARVDSVYLAGLPDSMHLAVRSGAPAAVRDVVRDPVAARSSHQVLASFDGGRLTSGDLARWLDVLPPQTEQRLQAAQDDDLKRFVTAVSRNAMLLVKARAAGMQVVLDESYPPSTTDFTAVINKVISSGADAFLGGGHYPDGATLARQLHDQKADLKWVTILVAPDSEKFKSLGAGADGITVPSQWEPQVKYKPDFGPSIAQFTREFRAKFKQGDPDYHAATGYAEGLLLQHAIEQAGSIERDKVAAKLNAMDVTTFFGRDKFATGAGDHGLQIAHDMVLAQWQTRGGKLEKEMVWPDAAATAKVVYPIH